MHVGAGTSDTRGMRMTSSDSNVRASTTWVSDVCWRRKKQYSVSMESYAPSQITSVKVNTSLLPCDPNFTFLGHQAGPPCWLKARSHESSNIHPLAAPFPPFLDVPCFLDLSTSNTLRGFVLRTSQTATTPSCDATANLVPFAEKQVEKDAAK